MVGKLVLDLVMAHAAKDMMGAIALARELGLELDLGMEMVAYLDQGVVMDLTRNMAVAMSMNHPIKSIFSLKLMGLAKNFLRTQK